MRIDVKVIDFLTKKKDLKKAELLFVLLLYQNKVLCLSELKTYTHFINNKAFRDKLSDMKDIIPFELKYEYGVNVYKLLPTNNQYITIDDLDNIYKKSVKEILLYLIIARFRYNKKIFLSREFIENVFGNCGNFVKITKCFPDYVFKVKKKYKYVIGYDVVKSMKVMETMTDNLHIENKKEVLEEINKKDVTNIAQEDIQQLSKQLKNNKIVNQLHEQIKKIEQKRNEELEKARLEQENKDKVISDIQNNYESLKNAIDNLFNSDVTTLEYLMYNKCIQEGKDIFKNQIIINYLYKNRDVLFSVLKN